MQEYEKALAALPKFSRENVRPGDVVETSGMQGLHRVTACHDYSVSVGDGLLGVEWWAYGTIKKLYREVTPEQDFPCYFRDKDGLLHEYAGWCKTLP